MATCRKVLVRRTIETTIRIERSVARPGNAWDSGGAGAPEGTSHFEPEATSDPEPEQTQETTTEIRLELSEAEAREVLTRLDAFSCAPGSFCAQDALRAVLDGNRDFATRRPKGVKGNIGWEPWSDVVEVRDEATGKLTKLESKLGCPGC
jgi:hypothetical protein